MLIAWTRGNNMIVIVPLMQLWWIRVKITHYADVIMGAMTSLITSIRIVYSIVYSGADQRNIKAPCSWPLCGEFKGDRWIPRTNGQYSGNCFHLMTSSCWVGLNIKKPSYPYKNSNYQDETYGLMQDCRISIANALEILQPCTKCSRRSQDRRTFIITMTS